jgi:4-hydroxybenzoate polyprenyltransferase
MIKLISDYSKMIKFSHTIFALPFAGLATILAILQTSIEASILYEKIFYIILCMITARSAAMGFNRVVDSDFDAKNSRTALREIPSGSLSKKSVIFFIVLSSLLFLFFSYCLSLLCFLLSFPALFCILFYSYTKRFTYLCHFFLGFAIGIAPTAAYIAILNKIELLPFLWTMGLTFHIAGFDILYSTADAEFDKANGLHSIPSRFGIKKAFWISRASHVISFSLLLYAGMYSGLGLFYFLFLALTGILFIIEHSLVKENDLSKVPIAFFHINASISIVLFVGILIDKGSELFAKLKI